MDSIDRDRRKRRRRRLGAALVVALVLLIPATALYVLARPFFTTIVQGEMSEENIRASQQICMSFLPELEAYKAKHGRYPERLEHAVAAPIPPPLAGVEKWEYRVSEDRQIFSIRFGSQMLKDDVLYPNCTYRSDTKDWSFDF